jgi:putative nucleotidyltransferase with HDIG domain
MTVTAPAFDQSALDKVPPVAGTVMELLRSLDDDNLDASHLAKKIGQDPVLSARVLKIVNSPFYGVAGRVASLQEAVMVLGFSSVRRLALAVSLNGSFPMHSAGNADPRRLWRHSFCVALCAQALARLVRIDPETAFTAGLLHDIGRIALVAAEPARFSAALAVRNQYRDLSAAEQSVFGYNHAEFGARLLERWHLPKPLLRAVAFHHAPDTAPTDALTDLVSLADHMAHAVSADTLDTAINGNPPNGATLRLGIARVQCLEALAPVPEQLEAFAAALH